MTRKQVFVWTRKFHSDGIDGLQVKKQTGRPPTKARVARPRIEELINEDPQTFGYLKGRWALRDIALELKKEGIGMHYSSVYRILDDVGIKLKSPKLRAPGSSKKNYYKREQIRRYKMIAPALSQKNSSWIRRREMDRSSSKSREKLDSERRDKIYTDSRLYKACELFYHLILATQTHSMEYIFKTKEHRVSDASEQPHRICATAQNQTYYSVYRPCVIS